MKPQSLLTYHRNIQDKIQNYMTYEDTGKHDPQSGERIINGYRS